MIRFIIAFLFISLLFVNCASPPKEGSVIKDETLVLGAEKMDSYLPMLKGKRVGMVVNNTAVIKGVHIVDTLLARGIDIVAVFAPEHGFRGEADAGAKIEDGRDSKTGIEIRSLYGKTRKPTPEMVQDLDVIVFDIQDVGVRFYTYISTMHYTMEAASKHDLEYIVFDRPNPNGSYVDGPIREDDQKSFVGMNPLPIVHGMTVGELASMINDQGWLETPPCKLSVIEMDHYAHSDEYSLPIKPSPNLPDDASVRLYPSLCLFEGTAISVGRGTYQPFSQLGHPSLKDHFDYYFTPVSIPGMATTPKYMDENCYGINLSEPLPDREFTLRYLIDFYQKFEDKNFFFNNYFQRLAGTSELQKQIENGLTEEEIRQSWEPGLSDFKELRRNYLRYE